MDSTMFPSKKKSKTKNLRQWEDGSEFLMSWIKKTNKHANKKRSPAHTSAGY